MTRLIDDMNEQIRRTGSRMILGTESSASMPYLAGLPLNDSRRICQVVYGRPVPAYSFVYHRYAGSFLGNQCTVWQNVDCPTCPDNLLYRLAEGFCAGELLAVTLRADGSIAWGAADDWSEPPPDSETAITLIRNLNRLRQKIPEVPAARGNGKVSGSGCPGSRPTVFRCGPGDSMPGAEKPSRSCRRCRNHAGPRRTANVYSSS